MSQQYFTTLTEVGAAALSNAISLGRPVVLKEFSVGDGGGASYDPTVEELKKSNSLQNETYRGGINEINVDPDNSSRFFAEGVVPVDVGGWTVREAGWWLDSGILFAVTKFPPSYKSIPSDGAATELPIRTYIATGAVDDVELKIDPTVVLATRGYVDRSFLTVAISEAGEGVVNKNHVFMEHCELQLPPGENGDSLTVSVDLSVNLNMGQCRVLPPAGERILAKNGLVDAANFIVANREYRFIKLNGVWRV